MYRSDRYYMILFVCKKEQCVCKTLNKVCRVICPVNLRKIMSAATIIPVVYNCCPWDNKPATDTAFCDCCLWQVLWQSCRASRGPVAGLFPLHYPRGLGSTHVSRLVLFQQRQRRGGGCGGAAVGRAAALARRYAARVVGVRAVPGAGAARAAAAAAAAAQPH